MYLSSIVFNAVWRSAFFVLLLQVCLIGVAQELPPVSANNQTIAAGSYIIPLDIAKQATTITDVPTGITFTALNLSAYGLAHYLLQNQIPVKWVIQTPKAKDAPDFSALVERIFPTPQPAANAGFISSAFVIDLNDINGAVCNPQNTPQLPNIATLIANYGNNVSVYTLSAATTMNVRYTLRYAPQIAIINNVSSNYLAFTQAFDFAGVPYTVISNSEFISNNQCYTFILQPNANAGANIASPYVQAANSFISGGGNMWVQSGMALGLENSSFLMTTSGITQVSATINPPYSYLGNNLPAMQFEGNFPSGVPGSGGVGTFSLAAGSSWLANTFTYMLVTSVVGANQIFLTGADVNGAGAGGNLYYCGGNEFTLSAIPSGAATAGEVIQAQRLFLNAAFIPAGVNYVCAGNDVCICAGQSVTLGCTPGNIGNGAVVWTPAIGLSCTDCPNPIASPDVTTTYTVTSLTSGCNITDEVTVTVITEKPQISNLKLTCNASKTAFTVSFTISGGNAATYEVSGGGGTLVGNEFTSNPILNSVPYSFAVSDYYHCPTIVSGAYNCQLCLPSATLSGGGSACLNDNGGGLPLPITLTGQAPWLITYAINGEAQTPIQANSATGFSINATQSGVYSLISVEDAFCTGITTGTAAVSAIVAPSLDLGADITLCQGQTVTLQANIPDASYIWQDGSTAPTYTTAISGIYRLQVTHECGIATDSVRVTFQNCLPPICKPTVPTAFSPNADGVNDLFKPVFNCEVSFYLLQIFDRWGRQVYESANPAAGWNGLFKDETQPLGLYVWKLTYQFAEDANDPPRIAKGNVVLLW